MSNQREILTFKYKNAYGYDQIYKEVDVTDMTTSQVNALKARTFGEMYDRFGLSSTYNEMDLPNSIDPDEEDITGYKVNGIIEENIALKMKIEVLKELLREAYGN